jgi:homoserine O-acetyltransferase
MKEKFMSKTAVISASLRTKPHSAQAASSQPKPNDAFVELHDFVFGNGETLASLKLHYLTLGTPRRDASVAIANGVLLLHGTAGSAADLAQAAFFDALYGAGERAEGKFVTSSPIRNSYREKA